MTRPHQKLHAWQEAISLVKMTYLVTRAFPNEELYTKSVLRSLTTDDSPFTIYNSRFFPIHYSLFTIHECRAFW